MFWIIFDIEIHYESQILALVVEAAKLVIAFKDTYNREGWLILQDILNEWVAEGVASGPHDFNVHPSRPPEVYCMQFFLQLLPKEFL